MICFTIRFETRSCGIIFIASTVCSLRHVRAAICSAIRSRNTLLCDAANNFHDLFYCSSLDGYNRQRQSLDHLVREKLTWLFLFLHGHLARVSSSLQFTPLGLKASGVHNHCKRRRNGHRINNLLNTLNVKDLQNVTTCILPSSTHCTSSHGLPNILTQRFAKHSVSNGLPSIPAQARHSDLERSRARGRPHTLEFAVQSSTHSELISLSSSI